MKALWTALSCIGLFHLAPGAAAEAPLDVPKKVQVPAGPLDDAVESLARQADVNVIYPGDLLDGHRTRGIDATVPPRIAFVRVLEGTPLVLAEEGGALRIAKAESPAPVLTGADRLTSATWVPRELRVTCVPNCDLELDLEKLLRRLGASEVWASPQSAKFLALVPADPANPSDAGTTAHWETIVIGRQGRWRLPEGAVGIASVLYDNLRPSILPRFTTRNVVERDRRLVFDVLMAGPAPVASECHRVLQGHAVQRYCGSPDQWLGLRERAGFDCRKDGSRDELCATAAEWETAEGARATRLTSENEGERRLVADELLSGSTPAASTCHRVLQGLRIRPYCGTRDQWAGLEARAGFRCRNEGARDELCGTEAEWKHLELTRRSQPNIENSLHREAAASAEQNNPTILFQPTMGAQ